MSDAVNNQAVETQELSEILQVRRDKLAALQQDGRDPFQQTKFRRSAWSEEIKADYDAFDGKTVSVAGRIMSKRGMGKAIFCHIKDDRARYSSTSVPTPSRSRSSRTSANMTSAISSASAATCSKPRRRRYPCMCPRWCCFQSRCVLCRRSSTA